MGHLLFCIAAVPITYESRLSCIGFGWSAFFQSSRADSGGAGEIVLLRRNESTLSLSHGSLPMFLHACPLGLTCGAGWACDPVYYPMDGLDPL